MRFFKYLALLALATVPLLLIEKKRKEQSVAGMSPDEDDVFERDLRAD